MVFPARGTCWWISPAWCIFCRFLKRCRYLSVPVVPLLMCGAFSSNIPCAWVRVTVRWRIIHDLANCGVIAQFLRSPFVGKLAQSMANLLQILVQKRNRQGRVSSSSWRALSDEGHFIGLANSHLCSSISSESPMRSDSRVPCFIHSPLLCTQ